MANSLRAKISKLRHDGKISDSEYQELIKKLDGHDAKVREDFKEEKCDKCDYFISVEEAYKQGRADAIEECIKINHIAWEMYINDYSLGQKRRGQLNAMFVGILDKLEELKERKDE